MIGRSILVSAVVGLFMASVGLSQEAGDRVEALRKENAALRQRMRKMEGDMSGMANELAEIKKMLQGLAKPGPVQPSPGVSVTPPPVVAPPPKPEGSQPADLTESDIQKLKKLITSEKKFVVSRLALELYGFVKLDAAYDQARMQIGNYAGYVHSEDTNKNDNQFSMTARQTRLGLNITGPDGGSVKTSGKVEIDFYGGSGENKPNPMMRHAYLKLDWPDHDVSILAGQTSDVISPIVMPTVNYWVGWWVGDLGYRRPQIRVTKGFDVAQDTELEFALAATRTITNRRGPFTRSGGDTGEDAGFPTVQGRAGLTFPFVGDKPAKIGISGHWGEEEYDRDASDNNRNYVTWSGNLDLVLPITDWLALKGTAFTGENLDSYLGGIAQGRNPVTGKEISSHGGWVAACLGPWGKWRFNVGASADNVDNEDVEVGARTSNRSIFGNTHYAITRNASVALEVSNWRTGYKGQRNADSMRAQLAFIYNF